MDVGITNSFLLAKEYTDLSLKNVKDFHLQLAKELIGDFNERKRHGRKYFFSTTQKGHYVTFFPLKIDGKQHDVITVTTINIHIGIVSIVIDTSATMDETMTAFYFIINNVSIYEVEHLIYIHEVEHYYIFMK